MRRPTPLTWEQLRVGVLLLVALVLLALGIFFVGRVGHVFGDRYRLVTLMESGAGLVPGAAVQLAGQNVGQVDRIQWIDPGARPETGETVAVWLAVNEEVQGQIRADSRARLRTQGLLGDQVVDIRPGSPDTRVLQPGDTLTSDAALDYQQILEQASGAVTSLTRLTGRLETLTRRLLEGEGSLGRLVTDETLYRRLTALSGELTLFLEAARSGEGSLGQLLEDRELYDRMLSVTASLDTLTAGIARGRGSLGRLVASDSLYRELRSVAVRSDSLLARLEEGRGSAGKLVADDRMYEELLKTLTDFNALLADLRERPERYIPPVEIF